MGEQNQQQAIVHFEEITAQTLGQIIVMTDTLTAAQRRMVADNAISIAQAHFSENAWMRAIYTGDTPIGFIMLHVTPGSESKPPDVFLWRLMIAGPHQGKGHGRAAMQALFKHASDLGARELLTSCGQGEASPEGFYRKLGFVPTGKIQGREIELVYRFEQTA